MSIPLIDYTLHLADNALILGHRNSEWTGHGPVLEQDIALSNIALDLIGQARNYYQYAAKRINASDEVQWERLKEIHEKKQVTEDTLAYFRDPHEFKNCLLVEQPNGDWAKTVLRQFLFSSYQYSLFEKLQSGKNSTISAIAEKSIKEVIYHLRWSSEWVIRLGDGTEESHNRLTAAVEELWKFTGELFSPAQYEINLAKEKVAIDVGHLKENWFARVSEIFYEATLPVPSFAELEIKSMPLGGKESKHTEYLEYILKEMQVLQRAYPGCEW